MVRQSVRSPSLCFRSSWIWLCQKGCRDRLRRIIKVGTQFGTQKGAEQAAEAVDAVQAVRILLSKFSAC